MASPQLALDYISQSQKEAHVTANEFLEALDAHIHLSVKDRDLTAPPGSPTVGDRYLVAASPTGAWSGWAGRIAVWMASLSWLSFVPKEGWRTWVDDEDREIQYDGTAWNEMVPNSIQTGITAFAGGGQGSATQLTAQVCVVTTVATAADSVKLLAAVKGLQQIVFNRDSADSMNVFPASGDAIDGLAADTAVAIAAGKSRIFCAVDTTNWHSHLSA